MQSNHKYQCEDRFLAIEQEKKGDAYAESTNLYSNQKCGPTFCVICEFVAVTSTNFVFRQIRTGYRWSPVRTLPVALLWCDLGRCSRLGTVVGRGGGNKDGVNLRLLETFKCTVTVTT